MIDVDIVKSPWYDHSIVFICWHDMGRIAFGAYYQKVNQLLKQNIVNTVTNLYIQHKFSTSFFYFYGWNSGF